MGSDLAVSERRENMVMIELRKASEKRKLMVDRARSSIGKYSDVVGCGRCLARMKRLSAG